jgi:hypothetical protein
LRTRVVSSGWSPTTGSRDHHVTSVVRSGVPLTSYWDG